MALGHDKNHHAGDVEADAADRTNGGLSHDVGDHDLPEYEALDRFITRFDASGHQLGEEEESETKEKPPSFWKLLFTSDDGSSHANQNLVPPDAWLETDIRAGITSHDVEERRRRFGWNELTAEKENQLAKFLGFFQGPILYGEYKAASLSVRSNVILYVVVGVGRC